MSVVWPDHFPARLMGRTLGSSGLSSYAIALEAWRRGLEVTFSSKDLQTYTISDGRRSVEFNFSRPDSITRREDYLRLDRKSETLALLREEGIPTPRGYLLDTGKTSYDQLREISDGIGFPLVLKPDTGSMGQGVLIGLMDWDELKAGYDHLVNNLKAREIVVERHHVGDDYRILVVGDQPVGAVRRVPAHVIGDGASSVAELIEAKNISRKKNPFLGAGLIKVDYEVTKCLEAQGLRLVEVPDQGAHVLLRRVANASAGGDVFDVTDELPVEILRAAVQAVRKLPGIFIAGVDVLYKTGEPASADSYVVIEVNSRPQIGVNMYPSQGQGRDAPVVIIDSLFPGVRRSASHLIRTVRFNEKAVRTAILSGIAAKVTLPSLPPHLYPYRGKFQYVATQGKSVELGPFAGRTLQKTARLAGVSGNITFTKGGGMDLVVAAESRETAQSLVRKVSQLCACEPESEATWKGPVTVGFVLTR